MWNSRPRLLLVLLLLANLSPSLLMSADNRGPRVFQTGEKLDDARFGELRTLDSYHPFRGRAGSKEEWAARSEEIVRRVAVAAGLWPIPSKGPLHAVVHGRRDMGDYTIEKVYFESLPGHFVTGNLYRPAGSRLDKPGPDRDPPGGKKRPGEASNASPAWTFPAVLCPHGHWREGRFLDQSNETRAERQVKNALAMGAERFVAAARSPLQARCVQLARMGCVVFHYDMLANADSVQFLSHKISPREHMDTLERGKWGFAGAAAAARLQSSFGLQTWNSVRALDFVLSLPEVDPGRIAVTGASGGGTQTMMLTAVDDRVTAAFPCVMPSTAMQGGCTCENCYLLRIGQGNIDITAATAPRPLGITAADDWTIELETKGHPDLVRLYKMLGKPECYEAHFDIHFKHNYNHVSRTHMYNFINRHFELGFEEPVLERDFEFLAGDELTVWDEEHPRPSGPEVGDVHERAVCRWMTEDAEGAIRPLLWPADGEALGKAREVIGEAMEVLIGRSAPGDGETEFELMRKEDRGAYLELAGLVRNLAAEDGVESIPALFYYPKDWSGEVVIWAHPSGKAGLYDDAAGGSPRFEVMQLIEAGCAVAGADLFGQGESALGGAARNRDVSEGKEIREGQEWRRSSLYTYGYNHSLFAQRVHDLMTLAAFVRTNPKWDTKEVILLGVEGAGHWAAAAGAVSGEAIDGVATDLAGFRFGDLEDVWDADFLPGAVKYGDVAGFLVLAAPGDLWLAGADKTTVEAVRKTYGTAGAGGELTVYGGSAKGAAEKAVGWVLGRE